VSGTPTIVTVRGGGKRSTEGTGSTGVDRVAAASGAACMGGCELRSDDMAFQFDRPRRRGTDLKEAEREHGVWVSLIVLRAGLRALARRRIAGGVAAMLAAL
jgi:hypothetical protein